MNKGIRLIDSSYIDAIKSLLKNFEIVIKIPFASYLLYPFLIVIEFLSTIKIDLNGINVTCEGSKAPIELFINCCIMGYVIMVIESDFLVTQYIWFLDANVRFMGVAGAKLTEEDNLKLQRENMGTKKQYFLALCCAIASFFAFFNPLQRILQYLMSFLSFSNFTSIFGVMHNYTSSCNSISGVPNIDIIYASLGSFLAWSAVLPAVYTFSRVLVPFGDDRIDLHDDKTFHLLSRENLQKRGKFSPFRIIGKTFASLIAPDLLIELLCKGWLENLLTMIGGDQTFKTSSSQRHRFIEDWRLVQHSTLCSYLNLCSFVKLELEDRLTYKNIQSVLVSNIYVNFSKCFIWFISYIGIGHFFTSVGLKIWFRVLKKYITFVLICAGFWTDERYLSYFPPPVEYSNKVFEDILNEPVENSFEKDTEVRGPGGTGVILESEYALEDGHVEVMWETGEVGTYEVDKLEPVGRLEMSKLERLEEELEEDSARLEEHRLMSLEDKFEPVDKDGDEFKRNSVILTATIGPRAILLQIVPILTPVAVYAILTSGSPIFISTYFTKKMMCKFPPFIYEFKHAYSIALKRELSQSGNNYFGGTSAKNRGVEWYQI